LRHRRAGLPGPSSGAVVVPGAVQGPGVRPGAAGGRPDVRVDGDRRPVRGDDPGHPATCHPYQVTARSQLLDLVAGRLPVGPGRLRVGIDGRDGAGKTSFADELAEAVGRLDRPVVRVSADDFHQVRSIRYRRGRHSPTGFWLDSYDYPRLIGDVLEPFRAGSYRPAAHDLETDQLLDPPWLTAPSDAVLILDGLFLHRDELVGYW